MIGLKLRGTEKVLRQLKKIQSDTPLRLKRGFEVLTSKAADKARETCPRDQGPLRASIDHMVKIVKGEVLGFVFTEKKYGVFVHFGTGIFGPKHSRIYPKRKKVLKFEYKGRTIFAKSTKGQKPTYFMNKALDFMSTNGEKVLKDYLKL